MLDIPIGHQLDTLTYILGDFVSVSATATTHYQTATVVDSDGKPTGKTVPVTAPDQIAFTGLLKSGAICSVIWRGGLPSTKGRKQFIWEIDGEDGSIRLENDVKGGTFMSIRDPELYINGDLIGVDSTAGLLGNIAEGWSEFAKGDGGNYPTFEDALRNHRLLDAIERSAKEGRTIVL
jgi:predicted dehydrogenase